MTKAPAPAATPSITVEALKRDLAELNAKKEMHIQQAALHRQQAANHDSDASATYGAIQAYQRLLDQLQGKAPTPPLAGAPAASNKVHPAFKNQSITGQKNVKSNARSNSRAPNKPAGRRKK